MPIIMTKLKEVAAHLRSVFSGHPLKPGSAPDINKEVLFGGLAILIFVLIFGLWAGFAKLEAAVAAPGKVIIATDHKTIEHLEGGIVKQLFVHEGSVVKKGDLLIELDNTQAKAKYDGLKNQVNNLYANEARLMALLTDAKTVDFPEILLKQKDDPSVKTILQTQESFFDSEKKTLLGQLKILDERIAQLQKQIESYRAQVTADAEQMKFLRLELDAFELLDKKRIIEKPKLWASQREYARLKGNQGELLGSIAEAEKKIGETRQQALSAADSSKKDSYEKLTETQEKLVTTTDELKTAEDILKRLNVVAPMAGTVVGLQEHTIGGVISPGKPLLDIVPFEEEIVIEANISPTDIASVHPGLLTKVQLTAYKQRSTPWVTGKVIAVSADAFVEPQTKKSYYTARVKISPEELKQLSNVTLYPGMPVEVMIVVDNRTPLQYFFSPVKDSFNHAFREK